MARYYEINETDARMAHEANSMREFKVGSETEGYRAQVDEAYRIADEQAERFPELAEKAYALADRFARKYAEWLNEGYRTLFDLDGKRYTINGGIVIVEEQ